MVSRFCRAERRPDSDSRYEHDGIVQRFLAAEEEEHQHAEDRRADGEVAGLFGNQPEHDHGQEDQDRLHFHQQVDRRRLDRLLAHELHHLICDQDDGTGDHHVHQQVREGLAVDQFLLLDFNLQRDDVEHHKVEDQEDHAAQQVGRHLPFLLLELIADGVELRVDARDKALVFVIHTGVPQCERIHISLRILSRKKGNARLCLHCPVVNPVNYSATRS